MLARLVGEKRLHRAGRARGLGDEDLDLGIARVEHGQPLRDVFGRVVGAQVDRAFGRRLLEPVTGHGKFDRPRRGGLFDQGRADVVLRKRRAGFLGQIG